MSRLAFLAFAVVCALTSPPISAGDSIAERYKKFASEEKKIVSAAHPAQQMVSQISKAYATVKADLDYKLMKKYSTADLLLLFRTADEASFYTSSIEHALDMLTIARELLHRGELGSEHQSKTYFSLVAARQYSQARQWRLETNSSLSENENELIGSNPPLSTTGYLSLEKGVMNYRPFSFPRGGFMLVVAHPQCHFSLYAIAAIIKNTQLSKALKGRSIWATPQQREEKLDAFYSWNLSFENFPIVQIYSNSAWPTIDNWETPTFYFYFDGVLQRKLVGWPREGREVELHQALVSVGIVPKK